MAQCNEFSAELERITTELHVLANAVQDLPCSDDTSRDGISCLIATVAAKIGDMSRGRMEGDAFTG